MRGPVEVVVQVRAKSAVSGCPGRRSRLLLRVGKSGPRTASAVVVVGAFRTPGFDQIGARPRDPDPREVARVHPRAPGNAVAGAASPLVDRGVPAVSGRQVRPPGARLGPVLDARPRGQVARPNAEL